MNNSKNDLESLGHKLEELKNLFSVGERIIPGIQKLVDFINEMRPMLSHINESIEESSSKYQKQQITLLILLAQQNWQQQKY